MGGDQANNSQEGLIFKRLLSFMRKCIVRMLSLTPIPTHIAFIMDGNRRYAKQNNLPVRTGSAHSVGYEPFMSMIRHSYTLGVKYVTVYAFSIENFKRSREEVESLMDLLHEKIEALIEKNSIIFENEVRLLFPGNLQMATEQVRLAAEKAMAVTATHSKQVLSICIAYTSTDEIAQAVHESCKEKWDQNGINGRGSSERNDIEVEDIERHMYMRGVPEPDVIVRSSGETRLSNFLLWQSSTTFLYTTPVLWPEIGVWHLVLAVLEYQRSSFYLKKKKEA